MSSTEKEIVLYLQKKLTTIWKAFLGVGEEEDLATLTGLEVRHARAASVPGCHDGVIWYRTSILPSPELEKNLHEESRSDKAFTSRIVFSIRNFWSGVIEKFVQIDSRISIYSYSFALSDGLSLQWSLNHIICPSLADHLLYSPAEEIDHAARKRAAEPLPEEETESGKRRCFEEKAESHEIKKEIAIGTLPYFYQKASSVLEKEALRVRNKKTTIAKISKALYATNRFLSPARLEAKMEIHSASSSRDRPDLCVSFCGVEALPVTSKEEHFILRNLASYDLTLSWSVGENMEILMRFRVPLVKEKRKKRKASKSGRSNNFFSIIRSLF